jgi:hypothetical protein
MGGGGGPARLQDLERADFASIGARRVEIAEGRMMTSGRPSARPMLDHRLDGGKARMLLQDAKPPLLAPRRNRAVEARHLQLPAGGGTCRCPADPVRSATMRAVIGGAMSARQADMAVAIGMDHICPRPRRGRSPAGCRASRGGSPSSRAGLAKVGEDRPRAFDQPSMRWAEGRRVSARPVPPCPQPAAGPASGRGRSRATWGRRGVTGGGRHVPFDMIAAFGIQRHAVARHRRQLPRPRARRDDHAAQAAAESPGACSSHAVDRPFQPCVDSGPGDGFPRALRARGQAAASSRPGSFRNTACGKNAAPPARGAGPVPAPPARPGSSIVDLDRPACGARPCRPRPRENRSRFHRGRGSPGAAEADPRPPTIRRQVLPSPAPAPARQAAAIAAALRSRRRLWQRLPQRSASQGARAQDRPAADRQGRIAVEQQRGQVARSTSGVPTGITA